MYPRNKEAHLEVDKTLDKTMPHPSRDRTAWMVGTSKNDMMYISDIPSRLGPAYYNPKVKGAVPFLLPAVAVLIVFFSS